MLRKAQERAEKLRKRKEPSKSAKAKNPSPTNAITPIMETSEERGSPNVFVGASFLDNQEYPESKLTFTRTNTDNRVTITHEPMTIVSTPEYKERKFGNVPNVFSLLYDTEAKEVLETGDLETSSTEDLAEKEAIMKRRRGSDIEEKLDDDLDTIDDFQKEKEDVTATEEKENLEVEDVKTLEKEVERPKEKAEGLTEQVFKEDAQRAKDSENQLKEMIVEQALLKKRLDDAKNIIEEKESEIKIFKEKFTILADQLEEKKKFIAILEKEKNTLSLKLMNVEVERDSDIKEMEEEKQELKDLLDEKARKVDDVENKMKLKDSEMNQMRLELKELKGLKKQLEDQEKWRHKKNTVIERLKLQAANRRLSISEKGEEFVRLTNELSKSAEANESLVMEMSRLEEEMRKMKSEKKEKHESVQDELLRKNEEHQTANRRLSILNEKQERRVQNLLDRLAIESQKSTLVSKDSLQSQTTMVRSFMDKLEAKEFSDGPGEAKQTLQRQKTLKCDHCKKITHQKCASDRLHIDGSCPHCRGKQLDSEEFPALN
ncbi:hypothetical protein L5515_003414 [Caenorhabditis briggsae]|uniref:Uncharacterized protein n=1 Tax=Caenorhabditis briggsae TaxID=6238 RepID=A0AAE9JAU8_CAEBR|nr:hypothetical protein L5515_003414 [Caenorhabditis briggsae]